jgi:peroxiredoxin
MRNSSPFLSVTCFFLLMLPLIAFPEGYQIKFRIKGLHDTTCMVANYYGNGTYVKDTLKVDGSGRFTFAAKEDLPKGIYLVVITDKNYFEFIVDKDKKFSMETELKDVYGKMTLKDSPENALFYDYLAYNRTMFEKITVLDKRREKLKDQQDSTQLINEKIDSLNSAIVKYKLDLVKKHPDSFVAFFINAMKEPEVPEIPILANGRKDSTFTYRYFKTHFWDGTDFTDDRLLRTPIFHNKLKKYFDQVLIQKPDTIIKEIDFYIELTRPNAEMFKYMVWFATNHYETSEVMGFDRIFVHVIDAYYVTGQASWTNKTVLENLIKKANKLKPILIGEKAPNMIMLDTSNQLVSMHNLKADYLILLFWDPDCGHCEQEIPKLKKFYDEYKEKYNMEIFAVCSDTSLVKWKKSIIKRQMNWINVDGPRTLTGDFHEQYDIVTTPVIYILNRKKEIIAKHLGVDQIPQFLKNYIQYAPKQ